MKLNPKQYAQGDPAQALIFYHPEQSGISAVFASRLAAFAKYKKKKLGITSGYRDVIKQTQLYAQNCKEHPPAGNGYVAKPGSSWHNGRCAVDLDNARYWQKYMEAGDMKKTALKQELARFGLYLPLNRVDAKTVFEWWHIQPIECLGYKGDRTKFLDVDDKIYGGAK
jgi:LAS superfamily LD-carboxypeptidase LdcB